MNKEYKTIEDKLIVTNQYGHKTERNITNNFKEILITENNIEEINKLLIDEEKYKKNSISDIKRKGTLEFIIAGIWFIACVLNLFKGNIFLTCLDFALVGMYTFNGFSAIKPYLKKVKVNKKSITVLEEHLIEEKESLKELNKEKKNDLDFLNQLSGKLSTSEKIQNLKNKLNIIQIYEDNKRKFNKLYRMGQLRYILDLYGIEDSIFLEELIKNDFKNKSLIKNEKQKQKTLKLEKGDIDYSFNEND